MSNPWFRFKKFTIQQDRTSMKVCTDSCLFGAWAALRMQGVKKALDIGTGTGLIALMLAQRSEALIDAIESDPESASQAAENISNSPWSDRIQILASDVRYYDFQNTYQFIITNPPFFESDLRSPEEKKNIAKHDESLTLEQLIIVIRRCLDAEGAFIILLPHHRSDFFETLAIRNGFFLIEKLSVYQTPDHPPFRSICIYGNTKPGKVLLDKLTIKDESGKNSKEFATLMEDYYFKT